jgi:hypothetical protein
MSRRCFPIAVTLMILAPLILASAKPVAPAPSLHSSSGEVNDGLSESRFILSSLAGDQPARKKT